MEDMQMQAAVEGLKAAAEPWYDSLTAESDSPLTGIRQSDRSDSPTAPTAPTGPTGPTGPVRHGSDSLGQRTLSNAVKLSDDTSDSPTVRQSDSVRHVRQFPKV